MMPKASKIFKNPSIIALRMNVVKLNFDLGIKFSSGKALFQGGEFSKFLHFTSELDP